MHCAKHPTLPFRVWMHSWFLRRLSRWTSATSSMQQRNSLMNSTHVVENAISAYRSPGPRLIVAGTPSPLGNAKVHYAIESSGMHIVADESCTGSRYYRDIVDESAETLEGLIAAVADRYFAIDCSCFSPNRERIDHLNTMVDDVPCGWGCAEHPLVLPWLQH